MSCHLLFYLLLPANVDFSASPRHAQFRMQDSQACVDIPIIMDSILEGPERFLVGIILPSLQGLRVGSPNQTTITILDIGMPPPIGKWSILTPTLHNTQRLFLI